MKPRIGKIPCKFPASRELRGGDWISLLNLNIRHAIKTKDFPSKAARPANSRLDLSRLRQVFGVTTPPWQQALGRELDILVQRP